MLYMGVDLGGTGIKAGVVSENGEILSKGSTPTMKERPYQDIIRDIAALCEKVAGQANVTMDEIAATVRVTTSASVISGVEKSCAYQSKVKPVQLPSVLLWLNEKTIKIRIGA